MEPVTDFPDRFVPGLRLIWRGGGTERELTVSSVRAQGPRLLIRFEDVGDVSAARGLSGGELSVPEENATPAPVNFYYSHVIEGWPCEVTQGRALGRVSGLEQTAGGPMLSVDTGRGEPVSVPFTRPIVVAVDPERRCIVVDPPEGLMDL